MSRTPSHLTMEDLTAHVSGEPLGPAAQAHLAKCPRCRAEAGRWEEAAIEVQRLLSPTPQSPPPLDQSVLATVDTIINDIIDGPADPASRARRRRLVNPIALISLAVLAILGLTAYTFVGQTGRGDGDPVTTLQAPDAARLTSAECPGLLMSTGTVESAKGSSIAVGNGESEPATFSVTDQTRISRLVAGDLKDIAEGKNVFVRGKGTQSGRSIAAQHVGLLPESMLPNGPRMTADPRLVETLAEKGRTRGVVTGVSLNGFTVVTRSGIEVRVTASASTAVALQTPASLDELDTESFTVVVGRPGGDGVQAVSVQQSELPDQGDALSATTSDGVPQTPIGTAGTADDGISDNRICDSDTIATDVILSRS